MGHLGCTVVGNVTAGRDDEDKRERRVTIGKVKKSKG